MTKITLAVTGSIAAYKAADLVSNLTKKGHEITVLMSKSATQFITPLTLQVLSKNKVHVNIMDEDKPNQVNHIDLAKNTELFLIAPATADTISRLAHGAANDIITAVALALLPETPAYIAPAMNTQMYANPLVTRNIETLKAVGYTEIVPKEGLLACGDYGPGALANIDDIITAISPNLSTNKGQNEKIKII